MDEVPCRMSASDIMQVPARSSRTPMPVPPSAPAPMPTPVPFGPQPMPTPKPYLPMITSSCNRISLFIMPSSHRMPMLIPWIGTRWGRREP